MNRPQRRRDLDAANAYLEQNGIFPGARLGDQDLQRLKAAVPDQLASEAEQVLVAHGYEHFFNANSVIDAALPLAEQLLGFDWWLLRSPAREFVLSDRPMPFPKIVPRSL